MKYLFLIIMFALTPSTSVSQLLEVGGAIGGSNFIGDVGATTFISPNNIAISGLVKWNRSPRHAYRGSITLTKLEGIDSALVRSTACSPRIPVYQTDLRDIWRDGI